MQKHGLSYGYGQTVDCEKGNNSYSEKQSRVAALAKANQIAKIGENATILRSIEQKE
jgi:hypothetical protein